MSARQDMQNIRQGMKVYLADGQMLGTVERMQGNSFMVQGRSIAQSAVARVTREGIYLDGSYAAGMADEGEIRVAVAEERLAVGKREVGLGEVEIRKTVTEEQQSIPVTLRHEEVTIEEVDTADRPLRAGEDVFEEGTIRIAVRGEEAVVSKEAVVTGEVVIEKEQLTEQQTITDTVRRERVEVDQSSVRQAGTTRQVRTATEVEPAASRTVETSTTSSATGSSTTGGTTGGDNWEELREDIREGGDKLRNR